MRVNGQWQQHGDGVLRPMMRVLIQNAASQWVPAYFLVDTGADQTVLTAETAGQLGIDDAVPSRLMGLEGIADAVMIPTSVSLTSSKGQSLVFRGEFAAVTSPDESRLNILGRDILQWFAVIVDQPADAVTLVRERHTYQIVEQ